MESGDTFSSFFLRLGTCRNGFASGFLVFSAFPKDDNIQQPCIFRAPYISQLKTSPPRATHLSWTKTVMFKTTKKGNIGTPDICGTPKADQVVSPQTRRVNILRQAPIGSGTPAATFPLYQAGAAQGSEPVLVITPPAHSLRVGNSNQNLRARFVTITQGLRESLHALTDSNTELHCLLLGFVLVKDADQRCYQH